MNPILQTIIHNILRLKRRCPQCQKVQIIPESKRLKTVPCQFCGAKIAPRESK